MLVLSLGWIVFFGELRHLSGNATNQALAGSRTESQN
jgi:hypothetical protein